MEQTKVVAFVGTESYDIIHYLTRVIRKLGCKSLMVDCSDSMTLSHTVSNPLVPTGNVIDYRGVDLLSDPKNNELFERYDYVFIDFGFNLGHPALKLCEEIYVITDTQQQNVAKLRKLKVRENQYLALVVRNCVSAKIGASVVQSQLPNLLFSDDAVTEIAADLRDMANALSVQYDSVFRFDKLSVDLREFIVQFLTVDFDEKKIRRAFKMASKGK